MDEQVKTALQQGGVVDITTTGRRSGSPRRIEINFHHFDGNFYITGKPGFKRDWLANLVANPEFTVHLKQDVAADVPATASPIEEAEERADVLYRILTESWGAPPDKAKADLDRWVEDAPLVSFSIH